MSRNNSHSLLDAPPPAPRGAARSVSGPRRAILVFAAVANTLAAALYLGWLAIGGRESLLYDRDGVLLLLPVIPILGVFLFLARESTRRR